MWYVDATEEPFVFYLGNDKTSDYVKFRVDDVFEGKDILVNSFDMSNDGVIFIPDKSFPTPDEDLGCIIGRARLYEQNKFIEEKLVGVTIIDSNLDDPKTTLIVQYPLL